VDSCEGHAPRPLAGPLSVVGGLEVVIVIDGVDLWTHQMVKESLSRSA
jgi:hypothetical protein